MWRASDDDFATELKAELEEIGSGFETDLETLISQAAEELGKHRYRRLEIRGGCPVRC